MHDDYTDDKFFKNCLEEQNNKVIDLIETREKISHQFSEHFEDKIVKLTGMEKEECVVKQTLTFAKRVTTVLIVVLLVAIFASFDAHALELCDCDLIEEGLEDLNLFLSNFRGAIPQPIIK